MKKQDIPNTDSIEELARFWDTHDLTEFEDQLEEVREPVFERGREVRIPLEPDTIQAVRKIAVAEGVTASEIFRRWVLEKLGRA